MTQRAGAGSAMARRRRTSCVKMKTFTTVNDIDRVVFARGGCARVRGDVVRKKGGRGAPSGALAALG